MVDRLMAYAGTGGVIGPLEIGVDAWPLIIVQAPKWAAMSSTQWVAAKYRRSRPFV